MATLSDGDVVHNSDGDVVRNSDGDRRRSQLVEVFAHVTASRG